MSSTSSPPTTTIPLPTDELLDLVGLRAVAATPWRHLSGGEQQRLSLALALIGRPEVAFLDEPTAGVDPEGRIAVRAVVAGLKEKGVCVLLTTHELGEAEKMADRIVILSSGRIVLEGTPRELADARGGRGHAGHHLRRARRARHRRAGGRRRPRDRGRPRRRRAATGSRAPAAAGPGRRPPPSPPGWPDAAPRSPTSPSGRTLEDVYFEAVGAAAAGARRARGDATPAAGPWPGPGGAARGGQR